MNINSVLFSSIFLMKSQTHYSRVHYSFQFWQSVNYCLYRNWLGRKPKLMTRDEIFSLKYNYLWESSSSFLYYPLSHSSRFRRLKFQRTTYRKIDTFWGHLLTCGRKSSRTYSEDNTGLNMDNFYCIEGVVIAAQSTATFSDLLCSLEFRY